MICGLCGCRNNTALLSVGNHRLVKCVECGLIYTASFKHETVSYGEDYFSRKNQYVRRWDEFCAMFETLMAKIVRFKRGGKLLDVGAGVGSLLAVAAKHNFNVKGVEISAWAAAFAREEKGLNVFTGTLMDARLEAEAFDVIIINHVLEHVSVPLELLAEVERILKKDGMLVVGVPNIGSIMAGLQGDKWPSLKPEQHVWHFTPETLKRMLILAGFQTVYFEAKENYPVSGWRPKSFVKRLINWFSVLTNRSEAMLFFAQKTV